MDLHSLPPDLEAPRDDGAADHLQGLTVPSLSLATTKGEGVDLASLRGWTIVYAYPMTGRPGNPLPSGWNEFPGARGCTPQSCSFRDNYASLRSLGAEVYGLSSSSAEYQREAKERLELPFELLADPHLTAARALRLPTFTLAGATYYKRLTMILRDDVIAKVFYPIFPPQLDAVQVSAWLDSASERQQPT